MLPGGPRTPRAGGQGERVDDLGLWEARDKERHLLSSKVLCWVAVELDASVLVLPLVGFLPADDERTWATIGTIEAQLGDTGEIRRWADDPYGFVICSFWLVERLALGGDAGRAQG